MMTAALLALLLSQLAEEEAGRPPRTVALETQRLAAPETPLPVMDEGATTQCALLARTPQVPSGRYRVQCDPATLRCLTAPEYELEADGSESTRPLDRVSFCVDLPLSLEERASERYTFVPAIAESPPGWYRDERGRVMQFNFDLHRRVWLGGGWTPLWRHEEGRNLSRGRVDFGIITEIPGERGQRVHRLTLLETELTLGQQSSLDATLLRYDTNARIDEPLVRITTFVGKPRRFDFNFDMGTWLEVLRLERLTRGGVNSLFYTLVSGQLTLDLWQSRDLSSYVRVRAGPSVEYDATNRFFTFVPGAVLEGDLTLDAHGFHHLTAGIEAEKILFGDAVEQRAPNPGRLRLRAGYELILLAINDQPVSLVLEGRGQWREDLAGVPTVWEWSAHTGMRFSLWAPARKSATARASR